MAAARGLFYIAPVKTFLTVLLILTMLAVLATLIVGVGGMVRGVNPRRSNKLMQLRVILQGLAIFLLALLLMMH